MAGEEMTGYAVAHTHLARWDMFAYTPCVFCGMPYPSDGVISRGNMRPVMPEPRMDNVCGVGTMRLHAGVLHIGTYKDRIFKMPEVVESTDQVQAAAVNFG